MRGSDKDTEKMQALGEFAALCVFAEGRFHYDIRLFCAEPPARATFGCVVGPLLGLPAGFAAAIGLVCVFCGAVNCPLASILLAVELFGTADIVYFALACGLAYMLSGYFSLYSSQKIMYSKLKAEFINIHAR